MMFENSLLNKAHQYSSNNRTQIERSKICGCFSCGATFLPLEIENWLDEEKGTAFCPKCTIDSVLGDASGFPVSDPHFWEAMYKFWFS